MDGNKMMLVGKNDNDEDANLLEGQSMVFKHMFAYADSLVLRSVVELRIADIIHDHGQPMSLTQIASKLESPHPDVTCLARVMRMLARKKIFTISYNQSSSLDEPLYGLTTTSKWLVHDNEFSLAPLFMSLTHLTMVKPWFEIGSMINEGGTPFVKAHGESVWEKASKDLEFNNRFNNGMASATKPTLDYVVKGYKDGFGKLEGTLVDVGGGIGKLIAKIVEAYPHIEGVNFDLPHAVANAPQHYGVTHIGGDMFKEIPSTENVIIKSVLLDWSDEDCLKILKNCYEAISKKKGRVIIVDVILHPNRHAIFDDAAIALDLLMMTTCIGGKQRTEIEWMSLLKEAGFTHINIIPLNNIIEDIIEACP